MRASFALFAAVLVGCPSSEPEEKPPVEEPPVEEPPVEQPIEPGTETVSTSWDVDLFSMYESPTIPRFDTMDGRRKLDRMTIAVDHAAVMTVSVENGTEVPLAADDFSHEFYLQTIIQLGSTEDTEDPPFFGPGSFVAFQSVDLAGADGVEGSGDDFHQETITDDIQFEALYIPLDTPEFLEAMSGTGELQLVVGGFSESWVYYADDIGEGALIYAGASGVQYSGTMTVTYEYSAAEAE
jgi:hypothetical protein